MKLVLKRTVLAETYTEGKLYIDGEYFCDTLEDKVRNLLYEPKVASETAIPEGTYSVIYNMSPRFKRELPRLVDVPYFEGILIHSGNTAKDSAGCILVGNKTSKGYISNSRATSDSLNFIIKKAQDRGESITIRVSNPK